MTNFKKLEKSCPDGIPFSKCKEYLEKQKKKTKKVKKHSPKNRTFRTVLEIDLTALSFRTLCNFNNLFARSDGFSNFRLEPTAGDVLF